MRMNLYNGEGYLDPTAYEALQSIYLQDKQKRAYRPLVYIASPFAGNMGLNVSKAIDYCKFALGKGCIPLAPHLMFPQFMDERDKEQRELGLHFALVLLCKCSELWVFGDRISTGMANEIKKARKRRMKIRFFNNKCEEVE